MISVGQKAPDFIAPVLSDGVGEIVQLVSVVESHEVVVLGFSPADFVQAPTAELLALDDAGWCHHDDIAAMWLTGDSLFSHRAYSSHYGIDVPLISDFHGGIADSYGLLLEEWEGHNHIPARGVVVVDGDWTVRAVATADPLAEVSPAPIETVTDAVAGLGFDVIRPSVDYKVVE